MAMRVFQISPDHQYWNLLPNEKGGSRRLLELDSLQEFAKDWKPLEMYVHDPIRTRTADFLNIKGGILVFKESVLDSSLGEIISAAGELLEIRVEGLADRCYILHPLVCYNCFDRANSEFRTTPDGSVVIEVKKYSFYPHRIGACTLFKVPETHRVELYSWVEAEGGGDEKSRMDEFVTQYDAGGFTGLRFDEIWVG